MREINHYKWLDQHLQSFFTKLNVDCNNGIIVAHSDKCYGYESKWKEAGIPFHHGVALYLLCYLHPYSKEVRDTAHGWVKPDDWVIENYPKYKQYLDP